jgi:hypothetical protein
LFLAIDVWTKCTMSGRMGAVKTAGSTTCSVTLSAAVSERTATRGRAAANEGAPAGPALPALAAGLAAAGLAAAAAGFGGMTNEGEN